MQWGQWCVQTVKAERKPPSAAAAHSTAYIFPIGPLSCHLELLKVTLLHGCIYKEIPHSGSVSSGEKEAAFPQQLRNTPSQTVSQSSPTIQILMLHKITVKQFLPE